MFDCLRQIKGTRRRRRWYQLKQRQTPLSSVTLYYVCSLCISISYRWIGIGWKWCTWSNTSCRKSVIGQNSLNSSWQFQHRDLPENRQWPSARRPRRVARRHDGHLMPPLHLPPHTRNTRSDNGHTRLTRTTSRALQRTYRERPLWHGIEAVAAVYLGYFRRQMTVVEIIIAELHCLSNVVCARR